MYSPEEGKVTEGLEAISGVLKEHARVLITSHVQPDGDAIGSALALAAGLRSLGKEAGVVAEDYPRKYRFLDTSDLVRVTAEVPPRSFFQSWDLGVLLDASAPSRTGILEPAFFSGVFPIVCIDHHVESPRERYLHHVIDPAAASTGSLVLRLLDCLGVELDVAMAQAIFVAIATDTGWFRYTNTTPSVFEDAARLLSIGIEPEKIYRTVYEDFSLARTRLGGEVSRQTRSEHYGAFLWSFLNRKLIEESGVRPGEFEGLIDPIRGVNGAEVVALLTEVDDARWKVSLRARASVDVSEIARRLGGGGHAKAAGARLEGSLEVVMDRLRQEVGRALKSNQNEPD